MVRRLCRDGDGVQVVVGTPGTGKTFALGRRARGVAGVGFVVSGAAVARQAARGLWDAAGIESTSGAALVGELRRSPEWGLSARTVLVVDEAGMLGTRNLAELLTHAAAARAKVVLVGDHHQLPEIDRRRSVSGARSANRSRAPDGQPSPAGGARTRDARPLAPVACAKP
jgi:ATP-dependent exoDNAse (exonuclease V) alpha subunit